MEVLAAIGFIAGLIMVTAFILTVFKKLGED